MMLFIYVECRASLDGLTQEVASAKASLEDAENEEAQARQRAEEALEQLGKQKALQEKLRAQDDDNEQRIQVLHLCIWHLTNLIRLLKPIDHYKSLCDVLMLYTQLLLPYERYVDGAMTQMRCLC